MRERELGTHEAMCRIILHLLNSIVAEPSPFIPEVVRMDTSSINVSWSQSPTFEGEQQNIAEHYDFSLTISYGSTTDMIFVNETNFYLFTAPNNAPPCQVYNFSVTATPVGATYTGDDCSVPSPVLSVVLPPPLPDTESITSSLQYSVAKRGDGRTILRISFMVSNYLNHKVVSCLP